MIKFRYHKKFGIFHLKLKEFENPLCFFVPSMGFLRFGNPNSNSWQDQLTLRFGINQTKYQYYLSQSNLIENSISFGFGFKFGLIGNQIDMSYRFGNREGLNLKETIQNLNISISLGDIWFLKRRN